MSRVHSRRASSDLRVEQETSEVLSSLRPLVDALAGMFGPHLEVVLHDLRIPEKSIVAINNGHVTGRQVGGPIIGGPEQDKALRMLRERGSGARALVNYSTRTPNGRDLKSSSIVYYSATTGEPIVSLCLNYDMTGFQAATAALEAFMRVDGLPATSGGDQKMNLAQNDLETIIQRSIDKEIAKVGKPVALMNKDEKSAIVAALDDTGLFMIRGAVERVAHALGTSRFTVYNYLKENRNRRSDEHTSHTDRPGAPQTPF